MVQRCVVLLAFQAMVSGCAASGAAPIPTAAADAAADQAAADTLENVLAPTEEPRSLEPVPAGQRTADPDAGARKVCGPAGAPCDPRASARSCTLCDGFTAVLTCRCVASGAGASGTWRCIDGGGVCPTD